MVAVTLFSRWIQKQLRQLIEQWLFLHYKLSSIRSTRWGGVSQKQPEGIQFTNIDGRVTIHNLDLNRAADDCNNDNNSNASDESFDHNKRIPEENDNKEKTSEDLIADETQERHFQNPIEQHHSLLMSLKARSVVKPKKNKLTELTQQDDVNKLDNALSNSGLDDDGNDDGNNNDNDNITSKPGVGIYANDSTQNSGARMEYTTDEIVVNRVVVPQ